MDVQINKKIKEKSPFSENHYTSEKMAEVEVKGRTGLGEQTWVN
jgi:hypothetical protein